MTLTDKQKTELALLNTYVKLADTDPTFVETIRNSGLSSAEFIVKHHEQFERDFTWGYEHDEEIGELGNKAIHRKHGPYINGYPRR